MDENNPHRGTETVEDIISLPSILHRFYLDGAFALQPIQMLDDKTLLKLEFHWLVVEKRDVTTKVDLLDKLESTISLRVLGNGYGPSMRHNPAVRDSFTMLISSTRFTMSTDIPDYKTLLDLGLRELQWHL
jgi:hypothetical protein